MTQTRKWTVWTVVLAVAIAAAGWFLLISPKRAEADSLNTQAAAVEADNATLEAQIATLKLQQKQLPKWQAQLAELRTQLPATPALPSLIRTLSAEADKSGVKLIALSPATPVTMVPAEAADTADVVETPTTGLTPAMLAAQDLTLQVTGGYFEIQQFVNRLERMDRVLLVLGLNVAEPDGEDAAAGTLAGTVTGRVFMVPPATTSTSAGTTPAAE